MLKQKYTPYKIINLVFIFIISGVFFYAYLYPFLTIKINSSCEGLPYIYCKSRGLSRAFAEIVRFNFKIALTYNTYSIRIFLFFLLQLIVRIVINLLPHKFNYTKILYFDISQLIIFFYIVFYQL